MWQLAARRIDPAREDEVCARLFEVEQASFDRTTTDQRSSTLADLLRAASTALGIDVAEVVLEEAATHYLDAWTPHVIHDEDAVPVLAALRDAGIRTGLLSNTHWPRAFHEHFLERDGLAPFLDERLYTSEMTHMKPHPKAFREAMRALDVTDASRAVFVGDRPYDDIWGAAMSGLRTVWRRNDLVPTYEQAAPDAVIDRLPELLGVIEDWGGPAPGTQRPRK